MDTQAFESGQREVLERIASGAPLTELLDRVIELVERQAEGMLCSIVLVDSDRGVMRHGAARSLPPELVRGIDGLSIGPHQGSCGTAAYRRERVVVEDIATHEDWADYRHLALPFGLRACWSTPIFSSTKALLGTFAMYYREPRGPRDAERHWVERATHLASIAIERAQAEEAIRFSEVRFRQIVDTAYEGVWVVDTQARTQFVNDRLCELFGYPRAEMIGRLAFDFVDDADRARAERNFHLRPGIRELFEYQFRRKDGGRMWGTLAASPLRDRAGRVVSLLGMVTDITEKRRLERQVIRAQRLESLGTLAGGIAHDFNNILSAVIANVSIALSDLEPHHPARESLLEIEKASERATDLVKQILTFSRQEKPKRQFVRPADIVVEAMKLLKATTPAAIRIQTRFDPGTPQIFADPSQLHQVIVNLATNATHAMAEGRGTLTIEVEASSLSAPLVEGPSALPAGHYATLAVTDTGTGMDAATLERIFDPFFTTKEVGEGTGLGLAVVHGILKAHDGGVTVRSELGVGTTFRVFLPAAKVLAEGARPAAAAEVRGRGGRVLCVDDEEAIVTATTRALGRLGYEVTGAVDPLQALESFQSDPSRYDAVVVDNSMPGISGLELARAILRLRPRMPVVMTSGSLPPEDASELKDAGVAEVVPKPSSPQDLAAALRRALERAAI